MYHIVEFVTSVVLDLETSGQQPLERIAILQGTRLPAQLKPYVVESADGPVEVADLFLEDDTAIRGVPFAFLTLPD